MVEPSSMPKVLLLVALLLLQGAVVVRLPWTLNCPTVEPREPLSPRMIAAVVLSRMAVQSDLYVGWAGFCDVWKPQLQLLLGPFPSEIMIRMENAGPREIWIGPQHYTS